MRLVLETPDPPKLEPLLESLSRQYQQVMDALLDLQREDRTTPILQAMQAQQDGLVQAFQAMMGAMYQGRQEDQHQIERVITEQVAAPQQQASDALLSAIRGMKRSLSGLPEELGSAMNKHLKSRQQEIMKAPAPKREAASSNRVVEKLDQMETALLQGLKRSRSRTFGSNY